MFQLFYYKQSTFKVMKVLYRESRVALAYKNTIIEHGVPNAAATDNTKYQFVLDSKTLFLNTQLIQVKQYHTDNTKKFTKLEGGNLKYTL